MNYFNPPDIADWYGADTTMIEKSGFNIPYGGWGRVQPVFGEAYGADSKALPYGGSGYTQPVYSDWYGALNISETVTSANFLAGFVVGALAIIGVGYYMRKGQHVE